MISEILDMSPAPTRDPIVDPKRGGLLTLGWEGWFHRLRDVILKRPSCHVSFTANQSIADSTWQDVLWSAEDHNNAAMHSTASNTDRITIPSDGIYCFGSHGIWDANAAGDRLFRVTLNDPAPPATVATLVNDAVAVGTGNFAWHNPGSRTRELVAGDVLRVAAYQNSGGALAVLGTTSQGPAANGFWCYRVSI